MKRLRLLCPFAGHGTAVYAASWAAGIAGGFICSICTGTLGKGGFFSNFIAFGLIAAACVLIAAFIICNISRKADKAHIAEAEPLVWLPVSDEDMSVLKARCSVNWYIYAAVYIALFYCFMDQMSEKQPSSFMISFLIVSAVAVTLLFAAEILNCRFWKKDGIYTESDAVSVYENRLVSHEGAIGRSQKYYMTIYLQDGRYTLAQYDNTYECSEVHLIRRGNRIAFVQAYPETRIKPL